MTRSASGSITRSSRFWIGVNPVNSSKTITLSLMSSDSSATSHKSVRISSAVMYFPSIYSRNPSYIVRISCILQRRVSPTSCPPRKAPRSSGVILYCAISEIRDLISPIYPILLRLPPSTESSFFLSSATLRSTRFLPVSSKMTRSCIPRSSNTRYARRTKLSTSTFMMAWLGWRHTSSRCVCIVNCSGTSKRKFFSGSLSASSNID